jgi:ATP-dependent Lon protease
MKAKMTKKQLPRFNSPNIYELKPEQLRWECDPNIFEFDSTESLQPIEGILGQERALKAIRLGVDLRSPGYNIYIAGLSGTGKMTTVKQMLESISSNEVKLNDYAYVNNFRDSDRPILLKFEVGKAREFKEDLASAIVLLQRQIPQTLESKSYISRKQKLLSDYHEKEQALLNSFNEKLKKENFTLGQIKVGEGVRPEIFPIVDNQPVSVYQLEELIQQQKITKEAAQEIIKNYSSKQEELQSVFKKGLKLGQDFQKQVEKLERECGTHIIRGVISNLKEKYSNEKILDYLGQVEENILENLQIFKGIKPEAAMPEGFVVDYFKEYEVNIVLDNSSTEGCPVIIETSPTYINLFGTIEKTSDGRGGYYTDFTRIKTGSILRANGGYLVLNVAHLFEEPGVWRNLKRVLTYRKLEIQDNPNYFQLIPTSLKPEPIEIDAKVMLVGSQLIYSILSQHEYDFKKIFKVKADFDYEIKTSEKVIVEYARVIKKLIKEEGLCEFDKSALSELIEISARFAGHKNKLTTRFSKIADLAREANFWAIDDGFNVVSAAHVRKAFALALERHGMLETKLTEMIEEKMVLLDTDGERVGQINGLAIYGADFYSFARPTRITATVSLGSGSIINVEREAGMSGRHYNKGVLIISGYFRETFGQDLPLSFNANLVFEQSYGTVDGDSASCAEIFALLSTLSGLPIKQSLAVTGSLNQKGDVQPIGGVNEKIEGFYDTCKARGLTGKQGVIIPVQNIQELMLREDIIEAVSDGKFHIYAIERVEEGIELLTSVKAGKKTGKGYDPGSVFDLVEKKIKDLYAKSKAVKPANETQPVKKQEKKKNEKRPRRKIR